eukprot:3088145-Prymnesium_polylepis.2
MERAHAVREVHREAGVRRGRRVVAREHNHEVHWGGADAGERDGDVGVPAEHVVVERLGADAADGAGCELVLLLDEALQGGVGRH